MRVTVLIKLFIVLFAVLAGVNVFFSTMSSRAVDEMYDVYIQKNNIETAIFGMRIGSANMTRMGRFYVVHKEPEHYLSYEEERAYFQTAWDAFFSANPTQEEIALLQLAMVYQYALRDRDARAFQALAAGEHQRAMDIIYEPVFVQYDLNFTHVFNKLDDLITARTQAIMDTATRNAKLYGTLASGATVLFAAFSVVGTIYILREVKAAMARERDAGEKERRADEENRAKTRFLARMSHEIRTPMNAVLGITEIQLQNGKHPPETEEAFLRIYSSSNLLLTIINDILDLSKIEAEKMEVVPDLYEVASLIVDTTQLNLMQIGSKNIDFKLEIDPGIPAYLIGDELRNKQIFNNLLSNAFKYTLSGQVTLSFRAEEAGDEDAVLVVSVRDTGQGMTQEQINRLFEIEFTRFNLHSNRAIEGSGLGMMISHQLVKMMGGDILVESEVGKGSVFTVRIPQKRHSAQTLAQETIENLQNLEVNQRALKNITKFTREPMPYGRVLVVDDVESNLYVAKNFLMPYKLTVHTVTSGQEAIEKVKSNEVYDIIFMDHMMPGMDGIKATKMIRDLGYDRPIIALTANTFKGVDEMFLNNGFSGFISKPVDFSLLNSYLIRYVRGNRPAETAPAAEPGDSAKPRISLAGSFLADARNALEVLAPLTQDGAFSEGALEGIALQAHAMKSALGNIGQGGYSTYAAALETAANNADTPLLQILAPHFTTIVREIMDNVTAEEKAAEEKRQQADAPPLNREALLAILAEIAPLLESGNISYMEYTDQLRHQPDCAALVAHMDNFNAPEAAQALAQMVNGRT